MINWSNAPPTDPSRVGLPLQRTPAARPLTAIVTSDDLLGCYTHFFGGRTVPHEVQNCVACQKGVPYRWHGYVSAVDVSTHLHFLFETTAQAAEAFTQYRKANGKLRGCLFEATRMHRRHNGRVIIRTKPADLGKVPLPDAPDLRVVLSVIWNISTPSIEPSISIKGAPSVQVAQEPDNFHPDPAPPFRFNGATDNSRPPADDSNPPQKPAAPLNAALRPRP